MTRADATGTSDRVGVDTLRWMAAVVALTVAGGAASLPYWVAGMAMGLVAVRLVLAVRGHDAPPRAVRLLVTMIATGLLYQQYRTFNGLTAGTALLSLVAGLKFLETRSRRDVYVVTMIVFFLSLAMLLEGQSFWMLGYMIAIFWLTTAALLRLAGASRAGPSRASLRIAGGLLAQAVPIALACWLFFPRFDGPLWQLPDDGSASSGLSDSMSPGDISDLANSDEVAFRVRFAGDTPPAEERYYRGPVLHDFDGRAWRRGDAGPARVPALAFRGAAYRYTLSLEPHAHNWLFALDWPAQWDAASAFLTDDDMLIQTKPVSQPTDVGLTSYTHAQSSEGLGAVQRLRETQPATGNPRTLRLAETLRAAHPGDLDYVHAVLDMIHEQPYFYTLQPPRLGGDSVDAFLFDSKRGFCGHYASAFAVLMRDARIPARVVTGYHGGTYNRFGRYWIVRQSDAHAWDEVWIDGAGWLRVDPTAAIDPRRVDRGAAIMTTRDGDPVSRWQRRNPWFVETRLRLDSLRLLWRERILGFDQRSQEKLLEAMHVPDPGGEKLALMLAVCLTAAMLWLTWQVRRDLRAPRRDPLTRAFDRLCRRLAKVGLLRAPAEGAEDFGARCAALRPDLAEDLTALCAEFSRLRYEPAAPAQACKRFIAAADAFRPRRDRSKRSGR